MTSALDTAIQAVTAAEATLTADNTNLSNIETAIQTASAPLPAAQAQVATDTTAFNSSLDALIAAATAAKIPVPPPAA